MHTVIIHTLGAAYVKKDIYFLAYDPEQILWLEVKPDQIRSCIDLIRDYRNQRAVQEDYRLVILADLDPYANSEFKDQKERLMKLLRYWYIKELLEPMGKDFLLPKSVSIIFLSTEKVDNATCPTKTYGETLSLQTKDGALQVTLPYKSICGQAPGALDLTPHLGVLVAETEATIERCQPSRGLIMEGSDYTPLRSRGNRLQPIVGEEPLPQELETKEEFPAHVSSDHLEHEIDKNQNFSLERKFGEYLPILSIPYETTLTSPVGIFADLQINLAKLIRLYEEDASKVTDSSIRPNTQDELYTLLSHAYSALEKARSSEGHTEIYHSLDHLDSGLDGASGLYSEMEKKLREEIALLPGFIDKLNVSAEKPDESDNADPGDPIQDGQEETDSVLDTITAIPRIRLRMGWLRIRSLKREFIQIYQTLGELFDSQRIYKDQQEIISICAGEYVRWRTKKRRVKLPDPPSPNRRERPKLPTDSFKDLKDAREACAKGVLEQHHDYSQLQAEAARLHTDYRAATRFWAPDAPNDSGKRFRRFSLIMGILFVILTILPFYMVTSHSNDYRISRFLVFGLTLGIFALLYTIGVIIWLNHVANTINDLLYDLNLLYEAVQEEQAKFVKNVIDAYSKHLPKCLLQQILYDRMTALDRKNEEATNKYNEHMYIMREALDEIDEVRTSLRLPLLAKVDRKIKAPNYLLPPYHPENQKFYMLFERGNK